MPSRNGTFTAASFAAFTAAAGLGGSSSDSPGVGPTTVNVGAYQLLSTLRLWEMVLIVFVRSSLANSVSNVQTASLATGVGDMLGNKVCDRGGRYAG